MLEITVFRDGNHNPSAAIPVTKLFTSSSEGKTIITKISVALRVAEQLSRNYYAAYEEIRTLALTSSPAEKFAELLLGSLEMPRPMALT